MAVLDQELLITSVKNIINNTHPQWVLFSNGTYILFVSQKQFSINELKYLAMLQINEHGRLLRSISTYCNPKVLATEPNQGWVLLCPLESGFHTFIHKSEFMEDSPSELAISVLGRNKCLKDCEQGVILYVYASQALGGGQSDAK